MKKLIQFIESKIAPFAGKIAGNRYIQALQHTFMTLIPFITIGSLALVIISPPVDYTTMSEGIIRTIMYGWSCIATWTGPTLGFVYNVTMQLMALFVAIGLGLNLAKHYKMDVLMPTVITTMTFLVVATMNPEGTLTFTHLGGTGLFTSIIVSILSFELYRKLSEKKVGYINLSGSGVPPALVESLGNLVPATIILLVFGALSQLVLSLTGVSVPDVISLLFSPIVNMVNSVWGVALLSLLVMILWWFGIHDTVITGPMDVILMNNFTANVTAFAAGTAAINLPYIVTEPFWWTFMAIGGSGATLGLAILAATSKSKQIKTVGRLALVPSLFNINEPLIFGLPIMYNPSLMIPFILVMPLNGIITYVCMATNIINKAFANASWNMIAPIGAFIDTMDVRALILVLVLIVIDVLIYFPFFKSYERKKLAEEASEENAVEQNA